MTAAAMLDEIAAVTAERDRARDLAAALEARLELAERTLASIAHADDCAPSMGLCVGDAMKRRAACALAAFTAERDRARDLAAALEQRLEAAERVLAVARVVVAPDGVGCCRACQAVIDHGGYCTYTCDEWIIRRYLADYDEASR